MDETVFKCDFCDYHTHRKGNLERHFKTKKHQKNVYIYKENKCEKCGKKYKLKSSLTRHIRECEQDNGEKNIILKQPQIETTNNETDYKEMFLQLIEQNNKILETTIQVANEPKIINNNNINNQFNIMNYLNTTCKDAINFSEFIEQMKYNYSDILNLTHENWGENIKNTFVKQLSDMEQNMRPIHCCDKKRKKFFIKENNEWERDINNTKINDGLKKFHDIQCRKYLKWKMMNKEQLYNDDNLHYDSMTIHMNLCKPFSGDDDKSKNKVITYLTDLTIDKKK
jgi:hypothetical protein